MKELQQIKEIEQKKQNLINSLCEKINALPDNPEIERIGTGGAFQISSRAMFKGSLVMSPRYYDFKKQYAMIVEVIRKSKDVLKTLETIIETGWIKTEQEKIHPEVIEHLKTLL